MLRVIGLILCYITLIPWTAYVIGKYGTRGYYVSKRMWEAPHENSSDKQIKE